MSDEENDVVPGAELELPSAPEPEPPEPRPSEPESPPQAPASAPPSTSPPPKQQTARQPKSSAAWDDDREQEFQRHEGARPFIQDDQRTIFDRVTVEGNAVVGSGASQTNYANNFFGPRKGPTARSGLYSRGATTANSATYVPFPGYEEAVYTLREQGAVYLCGVADSGRSSTAIRLGTELCGSSRVVMIDVDDDFDVATLVDEESKSVLRPQHAHVLELGTRKAVRKSTLVSLAGWAIEHDAAVVVIGPPTEKLDHGLQPYAVSHDLPHPESVLISHLRHGLSSLDGAPPDFVEQCLNDEKIGEHLERALPPGQVADLARRLLDGITEGREPWEALSQTSAHFRSVAEDLLVVIEATGSVGETRVRHREAAARLGYAVFQDYTMTDVADAADLLYTALQTCHRTTKLRTTVPVFGKGVEAFLDKRMSIPERLADGGEERRAKLVDPSLAQHLLDVAWNDFDAVTRAPLLAWLDALVNDGRKWIVLRAAITAGYLATHDFSVLYQRLIRPWATSEAYRRRQAAAWALESAALNRKLTSRVTRQVSDWAFSANPLMNDTASLAYATSIGAISIESSLTGLRAVAVDPRLMHRGSVANAIAELYRPEHAPLVLKELRTWADVGAQTKVHAARSIVFLASYNESDGVWPVLMRLVANDEQARAQVMSLWQDALLESLTGRRAWETLLQWVLRGDHEVDLGEEIEKFALDLLRSPELVKRARFNLRLWCSVHPSAVLLKRIAEEL